MCPPPPPLWAVVLAIYPKLSSSDVKAWAMVWGGGFSGWDMGQRRKLCSVSLSLSQIRIIDKEEIREKFTAGYRVNAYVDLYPTPSVIQAVQL